MSDDQAFKPGDVVRLKSGGPPMTVDRFVANGTIARVRWFGSGGNEMLEAYVRVEMLRAASGEDDSTPLEWGGFVRKAILEEREACAVSAESSDFSIVRLSDKMGVIGVVQGVRRAIAENIRSRTEPSSMMVPAAERSLADDLEDEDRQRRAGDGGIRGHEDQ